ncbi:MAG: helix-turn-helix domain-containing protein [Clostridia bacterium]
MKLKTGDLIKELEKSFPCARRHVVSESMEIDRPLFYRGGAPVQENRIYICNRDELSGQTTIINASVLLLCIGGERLPDMDLYQNLCAYSASMDPMDLFNAVQRIFDRFDQWDLTLREIVDQDTDLSELLNRATSMLQNPLMVCSADYSIIARSSTIEDRAELSGSHISFKLISSLKMDTRFQTTRSLMKPYRYTEQIHGTECLCINLFMRGEFAYRILVANTERTLESSDEAILEHLAEYVRMTLTDKRFSGQMSLSENRSHRAENLLRSAISNEKIDYIPIINGLLDISWLPSHQYCCVTIKIGSLDYRSHTVKLLCNQLEELLPNACAFEYETNIVVIINLNLFGGNAEGVISKMVYFLRDNFLKAGVSNEFSGFVDMYYHHKQAIIALDFVTRQQSYRWILRFADIALDYMIEQCMHELPLHVVCAKNILNMKNYDEEHNTEFYKTLECYIGNRFNALQTAKALFIHRSTFLYRMERIKEMFKIDLNNDETLLYTLISIKMLELSKSMKPSIE